MLYNYMIRPENDPNYKLGIINEMILTMKLYKEEFDAKIDTNITFNIDDNIVNDYNGLADFVTKTKCMKYQKMKVSNTIKLNDFLVNQYDNNVDKYVSQTALIKNKNELQKYNNCVLFDEIMGNMTEEQIQKHIGDITSKYILYNETANCFLSKYGYFGNISTNQILTKKSLSVLIDHVFKMLVQNAKYYLNERIYLERETQFKKIMNDPELQSTNSQALDLQVKRQLSKVNAVKEAFNFPDNHILQQCILGFRDNLFTLYALLILIPETKVFLNEILNEFASVNEMDKFFSDYEKALTRYNEDQLLNREVLPTSMWESFVYKFIGKKTNGEIKMPLTDYYRRMCFSYEIAGIKNKSMTYENNILSGNGPKKYNYIKSIFDIEW